MSVLRNTRNENSSVRKTKRNKLIHLPKFSACGQKKIKMGWMGLFGSAHKWAKRPSSPKSVTHIIQR